VHRKPRLRNRVLVELMVGQGDSGAGCNLRMTPRNVTTTRREGLLPSPFQMDADVPSTARPLSGRVLSRTVPIKDPGSFGRCSEQGRRSRTTGGRSDDHRSALPRYANRRPRTGRRTQSSNFRSLLLERQRPSAQGAESTRKERWPEFHEVAMVADPRARLDAGYDRT